ncbi:MAG: hypothetical protein M0T82_12840 [Desulfobacteraceae bacterium]|nr:hypothetical protein [Desulfobacteraceae bacterium]
MELAQKNLSVKEVEVVLNETFKNVSFRRMTVFQAGFIAFEKYKKSS